MWTGRAGAFNLIGVRFHYGSRAARRVIYG
jgi:hypothetical protein